MTKKYFIISITSLIFIAIFGTATAQSNKSFTDVLKKYVKNGLVDYKNHIIWILKKAEPSDPAF